MLLKTLAKGLGISPSMCSRLARRGMPVDSIERAERWRRRHLDMARMKGIRVESQTSAPRGPAAAAISATDQLRRLVKDHSICSNLPTALVAQIRALLRRMPLEEFVRFFDGIEGCWVVWQVLPLTVREWDDREYESDPYDDPAFQPFTDADMSPLQAVASGLAMFEVDHPSKEERPAFRDCVRFR